MHKQEQMAFNDFLNPMLSNNLVPVQRFLVQVWGLCFVGFSCVWWVFVVLFSFVVGFLRVFGFYFVLPQLICCVEILPVNWPGPGFDENL